AVVPEGDTRAFTADNSWGFARPGQVAHQWPCPEPTRFRQRLQLQGRHAHESCQTMRSMV
ncbi:hypothetical protein BG005_004461, partial [Podila minutissima]